MPRPSPSTTSQLLLIKPFAVRGEIIEKLKQDIDVPITDRARTVVDMIDHEIRFAPKIQKQKFGLMHDLLTDKVPVTPYPEAGAA